MKTGENQAEKRKNCKKRLVLRLRGRKRLLRVIKLKGNVRGRTGQRGINKGLLQTYRSEETLRCIKIYKRIAEK